MHDDWIPLETTTADYTFCSKLSYPVFFALQTFLYSVLTSQGAGLGDKLNNDNTRAY